MKIDEFGDEHGYKEKIKVVLLLTDPVAARYKTLFRAGWLSWMGAFGYVAFMLSLFVIPVRKNIGIDTLLAVMVGGLIVCVCSFLAAYVVGSKLLNEEATGEEREWLLAQIDAGNIELDKKTAYTRQEMIGAIKEIDRLNKVSILKAAEEAIELPKEIR